MTVPITSVELIHSLRLRVETIHGQFMIAKTLLRVIQLVTDLDAFLVSYPLQPLHCHS